MIILKITQARVFTEDKHAGIYSYTLLNIVCVLEYLVISTIPFAISASNLWFFHI